MTKSDKIKNRIDELTGEPGRCIETVQNLLRAVSEGASDYHNSRPVVALTETVTGQGKNCLEWPVQITLPDVAVLGSIVQTPLFLIGGTDSAKTFLSERVMASIFGNHSEGWWKMEVNRGASLEDLTDLNLGKLAESTLGESITPAEWLSFPARIIDEITRSHAKLSNLLIHLVDGSGFSVRGDLHFPVGMPYTANGSEKRYSYTIATANVPKNGENLYGGSFDMDAALRRRLPLSIDVDELFPTPYDASRILSENRAKSAVAQGASYVEDIVALYEVLPHTIPFSSLGRLFLNYLAGTNVCVQSRSGKKEPALKASLCPNCHLSRANPHCSNVFGISMGLLLVVKEVATGVAALRAASVLKQAKEYPGSPWGTEALRSFLGSSASGDELYEEFRKVYLKSLSVTGEDLIAAYTLVAPTHVRVDESWIKSNPAYQGKVSYALEDMVRTSWERMLNLLRENRQLFGEISRSGEVSMEHQAEVERIVKNQDAAMLGVIAALRDEDLFDLDWQIKAGPRAA